MIEHGYLIVLKPAIVVQEFEDREPIKKYFVEYRKYRSAFARFDPLLYRGMSRKPLSGFCKTSDACSLYVPEPDAQSLLEELTQGDCENSDIVAEYHDVMSVYDKIENRARYEIIGVRRDHFIESGKTLGYDIGYWGGDHFSLIADTAVVPTWHGPPEQDYAEVADKLSSLNNNLLFGTPKQAEAFRTYYKTKDWAEFEDYDGQFCTVQIEIVDV